ncbi:hypothetical protein EVAR_77215_1 [Eumeta japonica]|uniref:Uncharacterized protein n=1 Tax=Eumeta variegata TaxID=151549 RepID=A0A4C1T2W4_EUMVA|nr:hypothetical protein EVAR_77215_1 [Eumeta japonica]
MCPNLTLEVSGRHSKRYCRMYSPTSLQNRPSLRNVASMYTRTSPTFSGPAAQLTPPPLNGCLSRRLQEIVRRS